MRLAALDEHDRRRTRRERMLIAAVLVIGVAVALIVGYEIAARDDAVQSIRCEEGDVTLVIERHDNVSERVVCPAGASVKP
jgi:hypothetical protein